MCIRDSYDTPPGPKSAETPGHRIQSSSACRSSTQRDATDDAPADYWDAQVADKKLPAARLERQMYHHALPVGWQNLEYDDFLAARRKLMAQVVKKAFEQLGED